jgi:glucose-6-phosphate isomerase
MRGEPGRQAAAKLMEPFGLDVDLVTGCMESPENHIVRRASDMADYYADEQALEELVRAGGDPLHYEVFEPRVPLEPGQLMFCVSRLQPGLVGEEFFMTRGHYHLVAETAEIYLGLAGEGLMLTKLPDGSCRHQPIARGRTVYVPPGWAHRSVNTGDEPLVSFCVYPAEAGHNYRDIETEGFPRRVLRRGDGWALE